MLSLNCKNVHHVDIYLPCNFEENKITHLGVLVLFFIKLEKKVNTFRLIFQKL